MDRGKTQRTFRLDPEKSNEFSAALALQGTTAQIELENFVDEYIKKYGRPAPLPASARRSSPLSR